MNSTQMLLIAFLVTLLSLAMSVPIGPSTILRASDLAHELAFNETCRSKLPDFEGKMSLCRECHRKDGQHGHMHSAGAQVLSFDVSCPKDCFTTPVFTYCEDLLTKEVARIQINI